MAMKGLQQKENEWETFDISDEGPWRTWQGRILSDRGNYPVNGRTRLNSNIMAGLEANPTETASLEKVSMAKVKAHRSATSKDMAMTVKGKTTTDRD